jgi:hypothetical protein
MSVHSKLAGPLRLVFGPAGRAATTEDSRADGLPSPLVELTVYAGDSRAVGQLALSAERVTDLMNEHDEFAFVDTVVQSLDDDQGQSLRALVITREEMYAVAVSGPRGNPRRRTRTRSCPVEVRLGRYDVSGNFHALPGTDPMSGFFHRHRAMVPLTEATIAYETPAGRVLSRYDTLLVNRRLVAWIAPASRSDVRPPDLVPEPKG